MRYLLSRLTVFFIVLSRVYMVSDLPILKFDVLQPSIPPGLICMPSVTMRLLQLLVYLVSSRSAPTKFIRLDEVPQKLVLGLGVLASTSLGRSDHRAYWPLGTLRRSNDVICKVLEGAIPDRLFDVLVGVCADRCILPRMVHDQDVSLLFERNYSRAISNRVLEQPYALRDGTGEPEAQAVEKLPAIARCIPHTFIDDAGHGADFESPSTAGVVNRATRRRMC